MKPLLKSVLVLLLLQAVTAQAAVTVTNISAGGEHTLFIKSDGSLWGMGVNDSGQLGDGTFNYTNRPEQIISNGVVAIAAGYNYSLFVKSDGSLWAMGNNYNGQLGGGPLSSDPYVGTNTPEKIVPSGVVAVAACKSRSLFTKSDGSLWGMGFILGATYTTPVQIVSSGVISVAAGEAFNLFVKSDGSLWAMGTDLWGQLGDGTCSVSGSQQPEQIVASGVVAVACGGEHSLFLKSDGSLWGMGYNGHGELGDGTYGTSDGVYAAHSCTNIPEQIVASGVIAIAANRDTAGQSLFLKSDGSIWAMGDNDYGQLGDGTFNSTNRPEQIVSSNVVAISTGVGQSVFLKSDGSLWGMGGPLGDGFTSSPFPEQIYPSPQPALTMSISSQTNLQFNATCQFGGNFYLLSSTNLTQPLSQWTPVLTNSVPARGTNNFTATLTNAVISGVAQQFYILQSQ